ncbi:glycosyltransferase [Kozakia baliensis]|uniref:glycosyltransferase n=1 Tax=Kozakia baliensis TaxID=153496 RepID=UPI00049733AA|nr:glycosyltransferase [Kozakia baliensis]
MHTPRVAIVHEWLEHFAGSERVVEQLLLLYPQAELFAVMDFLPKEERKFLNGKKVNTSFVQKLPFSRKFFRHYLGLMPLAVEQWDFTGFDIIISSHHAVAKGVITGPDQLHVCYVHSPMRYAWDMQTTYLRQSGLQSGLKSLYLRWLLHRLRNVDVRTASGVDVFIANSNYIARRIRKVWRRHATTIYPPVDVENFALSTNPRKDYIVVSRMVPYKRVDLIVSAFCRIPDRNLIVVGAGTEYDKIAALAASAPNIKLAGRLPQEEMVRAIQGARAFVFAAEEDFGIAMVEAQACGTPVIAYGRGGALDIVNTSKDKPTGVLFDEQTPEAIIEAIHEFERQESLITTHSCCENALKFSATAFRTHIKAIVEKSYDQLFSDNATLEI